MLYLNRMAQSKNMHNGDSWQDFMVQPSGICHFQKPAPRNQHIEDLQEYCELCNGITEHCAWKEITKVSFVCCIHIFFEEIVLRRHVTRKRIPKSRQILYANIFILWKLTWGFKATLYLEKYKIIPALFRGGVWSITFLVFRLIVGCIFSKEVEFSVI